jgi:hypothetical protein
MYQSIAMENEDLFQVMPTVNDRMQQGSPFLFDIHMYVTLHLDQHSSGREYNIFSVDQDCISYVTFHLLIEKKIAWNLIKAASHLSELPEISLANAGE